MTEALEQRMTAMRARLSHLSTAVDKKDEQRAQERSMAHRYYHDAPLNKAVDSVPTASSLRAPHTTLRERDVNYSGGLQTKAAAMSKQALHAGACSWSSFTPIAPGPAAATLQNRGVDAMLQMARQHALAAGGGRHRDPSSFSSTRQPAQVSMTAKATPPPRSTTQLDFSGLHTYEFQDKFPSPRRTAVPSANSSGLTADRVSNHPAVPRNVEDSHEYGHGSVAAGASVDTSLTSLSSFTHDTAQTPEVPFDAFRAVQERLRQKMRQLTSATPTPRPAAVTPAEVSVCKTKDSLGESVPPVEDTYCLEGNSPPPRPPPGARAETATPLRSSEAAVDLPHGSTPAPLLSASSQPSFLHNGPNAHCRTPVEVELSGGQPSRTQAAPRHQTVFYDSEQSEAALERSLHPREYTHETHRRSSVSSLSVRSAAHCHKPHESPDADVELARLPTKPVISTAPGVFSNPSSAAVRQRPSGDAPCAGVYRTARDGQGELSRGLTAALRSPSATATQQRRPTAASWGERNHGGSRASRRRTSTSPSLSHPRARSGTGSQPFRSSPSAPRSKPISLNVEATILASVTGAELFALLRLRGLIESEGDAGEYRLPPTRCHRLYVTADEHRQLHLLRQSIHAMEEEQKDAPSYQRPTAAARSRNANVAPQLPVTHLMDC
ncbi:hypothetical protein ABL78_0034 [Leptomonas seymouri]|uniref:Uncharacterized protein n=1 Tax=Leptomonas seymouri TaxID=5684 RepID=A0A0N1ICJ5_LEPSE|nr:hypothetical protein ABL78_0034 [Leptomonas seymouri]|eukprot:KPI90801.1 hypothetical protein ABL78_0034 [Leptomonas seymouri]